MAASPQLVLQSLGNKTERYVFLDLYRALIVLFMLEGHVLRELIVPSLHATQFFAWHEIFHGISGPGFLFSSGFTFAIAAQRKWQQAIVLNKKFFQRLWRILLLIFIGYGLHVPYLSLSKTLAQATSMQWSNFLAFDALQCIAVGLLIVRLSLFFFKQERPFIIFIAVLLLIFVYTAPYCWILPIHTIPLWLTSILNGVTGSPFPLFPYVGFLFAGVLTAWLFLREAQSGNAVRYIRSMLFVGTGILFAGFLLDALPFQTYPVYDYWHTSPNFFLIRLGILLLMLGSLWHIEKFLSFHNLLQTRGTHWFIVLGIESLFVYIAHLVVLCGWTINAEANLRWWFGGKCSFAAALLISAAVILAMIPMALFWNYLKKNHLIVARGISWWMGFCIAWSFLFHPY
ncbi:MAG TPA: heparan-alpha-glucosaminide N-acetyltransferase domain-containing protein [Bacteroidota bacterium]|nr:heparan-alpha-glucosaminide N-acetyltransferase domain-containing protein [Bacteroidota bacterium]